MEDIKTKVACFTIWVVQGLPQGWGNWAGNPKRAGFQPKMTTVPYIFLNFYDKFFESTVRRQNLEILTEHKPAWNHVTRTPAKSQKQRRPLTLLSAMVGWTRVLGFQSCSQKSQTTPKPVTLLLHTPVCSSRLINIQFPSSHSEVDNLSPTRLMMGLRYYFCHKNFQACPIVIFAEGITFTRWSF